MNRCANCGRKLPKAETTCGIELCKYCGKYEHRIGILERALELACDKISIVQVITDEQMQNYFEKIGTNSIADYFICQAEKDFMGNNNEKDD